MYDRCVDLGSDHFHCIFLSVELNDKAMKSTKVGSDRSKAGVCLAFVEAVYQLRIDAFFKQDSNELFLAVVTACAFVYHGV